MGPDIRLNGPSFILRTHVLEEETWHDICIDIHTHRHTHTINKCFLKRNERNSDENSKLSIERYHMLPVGQKGLDFLLKEHWTILEII